MEHSVITAARAKWAMGNQTIPERAAHAVSGATWDSTILLKVDRVLIRKCVKAGLFHLGHDKRATTPTLSQWLYNQMAGAIKERLPENISQSGKDRD